MPEDDLWEDEFVRTAKLALDAPATRRRDRGGRRTRERYRTVPAKYAALVGALLRQPPYLEYPGRVAYAAGLELLRRGQARWREPRALTILRYDQWARSPEQIDEAWLRRSVGPGRRIRQGAQSPLPDLQPEVTIGVHLATPLHPLRREGALSVLRLLHESCGEKLTEIERSLGGVVRFRLLQPGHELAVRDSREVWDWDTAQLDEDATVLAMADIGTHSLSFGVACELARYSQLPGEYLHIRNDRCPVRSNLTAAVAQELGIETVGYSDVRQIPDKLGQWILSRLDVVIDAARRRDDAVALTEPLHRRIVKAWERADVGLRETVRDAAGLTEPRMSSVLERPAAFAALPAISQALLRDHLMPSDRVPWLGEAVDVAKLMQAASDGDWPWAEVNRVHDEARRRVAHITAASTRPAYRATESFEALHDELYGR